MMAARLINLLLRRITSFDSPRRSSTSCLVRYPSTGPAKSSPIFSRFLSTVADASAKSTADEPLCLGECDDLRSRLFRLRLPKRSATTVIEKWVGEGNSLSIAELRGISRELRRLQRYKHALEISEWMTNHDEFKLSDSDYAIRIDLLTKVFGIDAAERCFNSLPDSEKTKETYTALLHSYASAKLTDRAEELFEMIINDSNLSLTAMTYNEMMTLYMSVGQAERVSSVVEDMKHRNIPLDLFTYNLWISSLASSLDISGVQSVIDEMGLDSNCNGGWQTYRVLAKIYISSSQFSDVGSSGALVVEAQKGASLREWITYDLLIILHAAMRNKEMIDQIWKSLRMTNMKMTSRNYMCALSAYLMLDSKRELREVIGQWKKSSPGGLDESLYDGLRNAFEEAGLTEKAETIRVMLAEYS